MKKLEFLLNGAIFLGLGFTAGYATAVWGPGVVLPPPVFRAAECIFGHAADGHRVPPAASAPAGAVLGTPHPSATVAPGDDLRARHETLALEVGRLESQLDELSQRDRERRIRIGLLERRDDPRDEEALAALHDEVAMIASALEQVRAEKATVLDELSRLELVLDAEAVVNAASVPSRR